MSRWTTADRLRLDSAVSSSEQTLRKWQKLAYGTERTHDPHLQLAARNMCALLIQAMQECEKIVRT